MNKKTNKFHAVVKRSWLGAVQFGWVFLSLYWFTVNQFLRIFFCLHIDCVKGLTEKNHKFQFRVEEVKIKRKLWFANGKKSKHTLRTILIYTFAQAKSCQSVRFRKRSLGQPPTTANELWHTFPINQTVKQIPDLFDANLQTQPYFSISFVIFPFVYAFCTQFILHIEPLQTVYIFVSPPTTDVALARLVSLCNPSLDVVHQLAIAINVCVLVAFCVAPYMWFMFTFWFALKWEIGRKTTTETTVIVKWKTNKQTRKCSSE